ncbi:hypothetical protein HDV05_002108 [Chytridiales sp. JEL 0842]|nr:hypothetical protein HDV05_002108 [Chytridiales sp. JEL 0842]
MFSAGQSMDMLRASLPASASSLVLPSSNVLAQDLNVYNPFEKSAVDQLGYPGNGSVRDSFGSGLDRLNSNGVLTHEEENANVQGSLGFANDRHFSEPAIQPDDDSRQNKDAMMATYTDTRKPRSYDAAGKPPVAPSKTSSSVYASQSASSSQNSEEASKQETFNFSLPVDMLNAMPAHLRSQLINLKSSLETYFGPGKDPARIDDSASSPSIQKMANNERQKGDDRFVDRMGRPMQQSNYENSPHFPSMQHESTAANRSGKGLQPSQGPTSDTNVRFPTPSPSRHSPAYANPSTQRSLSVQPVDTSTRSFDDQSVRARKQQEHQQQTLAKLQQQMLIARQLEQRGQQQQRHQSPWEAAANAVPPFLAPSMAACKEKLSNPQPILSAHQFLAQANFSDPESPERQPHQDLQQQSQSQQQQQHQHQQYTSTNAYSPLLNQSPRRLAQTLSMANSFKSLLMGAPSASISDYPPMHHPAYRHHRQRSTSGNSPAQSFTAPPFGGSPSPEDTYLPVRAASAPNGMSMDSFNAGSFNTNSSEATFAVPHKPSPSQYNKARGPYPSPALTSSSSPTPEPLLAQSQQNYQQHLLQQAKSSVAYFNSAANLHRIASENAAIALMERQKLQRKILEEQRQSPMTHFQSPSVDRQDREPSVVSPTSTNSVAATDGSRRASHRSDFDDVSSVCSQEASGMPYNSFMDIEHDSHAITTVAMSTLLDERHGSLHPFDGYENENDLQSAPVSAPVPNKRKRSVTSTGKSSTKKPKESTSKRKASEVAKDSEEGLEDAADESGDEGEQDEEGEASEGISATNAKRSKPRRMFACTFPSCTKSFTRLYNLRAHVRGFHTDERPYECTVCPAKFARSHDLNRHVRCVHAAVKRYSCLYCNLVFPRSDALKRHLALEVKRRREEGLEIIEGQAYVDSHAKV